MKWAAYGTDGCEKGGPAEVTEDETRVCEESRDWLTEDGLLQDV